MPWIKVKNALHSVLRSPTYASVTATVALVISLLMPGLTVYNTILAHRSIILTVAMQRPSGLSGIRLTPNETYDLSPIITNVGNRTEIISCVGIVIFPSSPVNHRYQGAPAGPYILKAGDAVTTPIKVPFDRIRLGGDGKESDVYVRVVVVSKKIFAVDIPVSHITFSQTSDENTYAENQSPKYTDDLIDILSSARSTYTPTCREGLQATFTLTVLPGQKHQ